MIDQRSDSNRNRRESAEFREPPQRQCHTRTARRTTPEQTAIMNFGKIGGTYPQGTGAGRARLLTAVLGGSTIVVMDFEDIQPISSSDPLGQLVRQDLDPLSVDELNARIATLESEIERCRKRISFAVNHRASADSLFKR